MQKIGFYSFYLALVAGSSHKSFLATTLAGNVVALLRLGPDGVAFARSTVGRGRIAVVIRLAFFAFPAWKLIFLF